MFFVFSTILEFAVVLNLNQAMRYTEKLRKQDSDGNKISKGKVFATESRMEEVRQVSGQFRASNLWKSKLFDNSINDGNGKKVKL